MKKKLGSILTSVALALSCGISGVHAQAATADATPRLTIFEEDFENSLSSSAWSTNGAYVKRAKGVLSAAGIPAYTDTDEEGKPTGKDNRATLTLPNVISSGAVVYEMKFKYYDSKGINLTFQDSNGIQGTQIIIGADGSDNQRVLITNAAQNAHVDVIKTAATIGGEPGDDKWHTLKLAINMDTKAIEVYYNGEKKADTAYAKNDIAKLKFAFADGKPGAIAIDDIKLSADAFAEDFNISGMYWSVNGTNIKCQDGVMSATGLTANETAVATLPAAVSDGNVEYEMKFKYNDSKGINLTLQDLNGNQGSFMIIGADNSNNQRVLITNAAQNNYETVIQTATTTGAEPGDGNWHTLKLAINMDTKAIEVYYDNVKKVDTAYAKDNLSKLSFQFNGGKPGTIAIDDIKISKDSTEICAENFESTLNTTAFAITGSSIKYEDGALVSTNAGSGEKATATLPAVISTGKVVYEMKFKYNDSKGINLILKDSDGNQGTQMIIGADNSNNQRVLITNAAQNNYETVIQTATTTGAEPGDGNWHTLKLEINMDTKAIEVYYDGVKKVDTGYAKDSIAKIEFAFNSGKSGSIAIDDIKLYSPENTATGAYIDGVCKLGETLTGRYSWGTGNETISWLKADTKDGEYTAIDGATADTLEITDALEGKYIKFRVTDNDAADSDCVRSFVIDGINLTNGQLTGSIENISGESRSCVLIVAAYDNNDAFVEAKTMPVTIEADETKAVKTEAVTGGVTYKGFVWDSLKNATPLKSVMK